MAGAAVWLCCCAHTKSVRICTCLRRTLSRRLMQLLRRQPWVSVVEQASIDEAYVLLSGGPGGGGVAPAAALQRAEELKAAGARAGTIRQRPAGVCATPREVLAVGSEVGTAWRGAHTCALEVPG